jgi:hypothetical protein
MDCAPLDNGRQWKPVMPLRQVLLGLIVVAALLADFMLYRSRSINHLNVTPDAQREIDKAKSR